MRNPLDNDGAKRFWLATKERELEAMRRMCAFYVLHETDNVSYREDFEIALAWWMRNRGVFTNVPVPVSEPEAKG